MTHLQKLKSLRLCLSAHPDNELNSEFADRISDLDELIKAQEAADLALLDYFAKAAMQSIVYKENPKDLTDKYYIAGIASVAYDIAEAMVRERKRTMKG